MLVVRRWLLDWIGAAGVVLVKAPAGSGKSITAEQIAAHWGETVVRLRPQSLDIDDLRDVIATSQNPTTLLIDDAHLFDPGDAHRVAAIVDRAPTLRTIIAGRQLGPFDTLAARADARVITGPQLMFTREEIAKLLEDVAGSTAGAVVCDDLYSATQGWPLLTAQAIGRLAQEPSWTPSGPNGVSVLTRDVLESMHASVPAITVLARLPLVDDAVASLVTGSADVFDLLPMTRLGRWSVMPTGVVPISDAATVSAALATEVARRYIDFGEIEAAAQLLMAECSAEEMTRIMADVHWATLAELDIWQLRAIVAAAADTNPGSPAASTTVSFLLAASRAAEYADRELWGQCLDAAAARASSHLPLARAIIADQARHRLRGGDVAEGAAIARRLLDETTTAETTTRARALVVLGMADAFECTAESCARGARRFREAASLYRQSKEWAWRADALARLGYTALYMAGYPVEGQQAMEEALALLPVADRVRAFWLTNYADVLDFLGRGVEADAVLREAIEIGGRLHDDAVLGMAWWTRSWLASHRGDGPAFRAALVEVERHRGDWLQGGQEVEFLASTAERHMMVGDVDGYTRMIDRARAAAEQAGLPEIVALASTWFEATEGDPARARDELSRLEGTAAVVAVNRPRRLLLLAAAHLRLGDISAARTTATEAMKAADEMGVPDLHARMHGRVLELLAPVLDEGGPATATMNVRMLGGFSVIGADGAARTPQPGHPSTLVKLLALNGVSTTETAIDWLWPDADAATGRARLRNVLNRLKERSGALIIRDGDTLRLSDDVIVDVVEFEAAATEAFSAAAEERVGRARRAVALYAGDLLPGDVYEDWATGHRERLRRRFVSLADAVAADAQTRGDTEEAARFLDLALEIEPLDEIRTLRLCEMLQSSGRTMSAASVARRCISLLGDLGLDPGAGLARFAALIAHPGASDAHRTPSRHSAAWPTPENDL